MADGDIGGLGAQSVFRVNVHFLLGQDRCQTGFYVRDVAVNDNTPETVANTVVPWVNDNFRTLLFASDTIDKVDVLKLGTADGFVHTFDNVHGTRGDNVGLNLPHFMCVKVSMLTQLRARYGKGRMFWPFRDSTWLVSGGIGAVGLAAYQGVLDALTGLFMGDPVTHDLILCNAAPNGVPPRAATEHSPARAAIPPHWWDVSSVRIDTKASAVRSRKEGVGA